MKAKSIYDFEVRDIDGRAVNLADYRGKVLLIVNVASKCGLTPQYEGLQRLFEKHKASGLVVLGFPCNQFRGQEPGSADEIKSFCESTFGISFPMFEKVDVNGRTAHPLYQFLKSNARGFLGMKAIKWNFTKFLVDRNGKVKKRFAPTTAPDAIESELRATLAA